jgi:mRNA interferase RelE/StbE
LAYKVRWHEDVWKDLRHLDKDVSRKIIDRVTRYLVQDPLKLGKPLKENLAGLFRYRFGDYRIMYIVDIPGETVTILKVRHRKDIYR